MFNTTNTTSNIIDSCNSTCKVETIQGIGYTLLFLLGSFLNIAALRAFIGEWNSWTDTHIYMFNIAVADFTLILFLPFRIYDAFLCVPKTVLCTFLINIHFINIYASMVATAALSVHRYLTIRFPMWVRSWRMKKKTAFAVCLIMWGSLVTICVTFREDNYPDKLWTCYERSKDHPLRLQFVVLLVCLGFLIPLFTVLFCSSQIIYFLLKKKNKSEERKSTIEIVTANMIVFICCYTPIHIGFFVNYFYIPPSDWQSAYLPPHVFFIVSEFIASTNCCFDSISYYFLLRRFYFPVSRRTTISQL